ncbi:MAG: TetR/AcrR family transcriptional regulator [Chloroflexota bacterium]|jgi:AcrR family transcriptional regulator|nr:TetR/AcrR family transcriptional regulator [Chloroflexota bacterium]
MDRIAERTTRAYRSELREEQADATRARILDATIRVMATGLASLSIPAVAREAGVSVPTIYRHFGAKSELLAAVYPHAARKAGLDTIADPRSLDELRPAVRALVDRLDGLDDLSRAAMASPGASEVRHATMASRYERLQRIAASIDPKLRKRDRDRITRLLAVLLTTSSLRMWRDHLGLSVDEVADEVDWIVRTAIAGLEREARR